MDTARPSIVSTRFHQTATNVVAAGRMANSNYADHSGWGMKQGRVFKSWKSRFFVLKDCELIYFSDRSPRGKGIDEKGRFKIADVQVIPEFEHALLLIGALKNKTMHVRFKTKDECIEWIDKISESIQRKQNSVGKDGKSVTMQGWLMKEGQNFKSWKKRYMTLSGQVLKYSEREGEAPLGEVPIHDFSRNPSKKFAINVYSDNNRIFRIAANSAEEIAAWDLALADVVGKSPCYEE